MKTIKKICLLLFVASTLSLISCSDDSEVDSCSLDKIEEHTERIEDAAFTFSQNLTASNCNAYKSTMNDFLDFVDGCPNVSQSQISQVRSLLTQLDCSDL